MGAVVAYLDLTQKGKLPLLTHPQKELADRVLQIDAATRRNLELTRTLTGARQGSLLSVLDQTVTAAGARLLGHRLSAPSTQLDMIQSRQSAVAELLAAPDLRAQIRGCLRKTPDMGRALSRLSLDRGGPRDLAALRTALEQTEDLYGLMPSDFADHLKGIKDRLNGYDALRDALTTQLAEEPPLLVRDGGAIAPGVSADLDEARKLRDDGRAVVAGMQADYARKADITALKIKHNNVLGYFIETPATHAKKMLAAPLSETFIHRQTTANAVRFTTVELSEMETRILNAGARAIEIETEMFSALCKQVLAESARLNLLARALAELDVVSGLSELAQKSDWVRPKLDTSRAFAIESGRHPVVEAALRTQGGVPFVANDCDLSSEPAAIWLLTGPNMSGKSTFLRQNALIAILAQMGSFVPAHSAHIGLVSQVFSRVGASDDLARGRSTFMVEMVETAAILNQADDRALVILDEIGRGTATYDGLSIAWAVLEHLHEINGCRALFATHYHEMTALAGNLKRIDNATVRVKEWDGDVIFLHEVTQGAADRSYGVQVAKLAGLPDAVTARARDILSKLESGASETGKTQIIDDLPLFSAAPPPPQPKAAPSEVEARLKEILPDELSPKDALALIYEMKSLLP